MTVAKEIELKDPFENMGARLLVEVATKTNDVAGDGTTTATVLAQAIVTEGLKMVAAGANPMLLKRGLDKGAEALVAELKSLAKPVRDRADIAHVAAISAADSEIGDLIAEVMEKVGKDGVITVEESKGIAFEKEYTEGMQIDRGYISAYFVTNSERMEAELEEPYILITDKKISAISEILPVLEKALAGHQELRDHRRGHRRRGAGDAGGQQAARHDQRAGDQGARLRRPPQGHAAGYRDPDRRHGDLGRDRPQARQRDGRGSGPRAPGGVRQGQHHLHRGPRR